MPNFALALVLAALGPLPAGAAPPTPTPTPATASPEAARPTNPAIDLVTVGPGPVIFHRWGHAALCVVYPGAPDQDVCYNYGAIFPTSVASLGWQFLRGTARFMVIQQRYADLVGIYQGEDRTVWVQRLPFTQAQVDALVKRLENDLKEENRYYTYHHMWDNCATRLRDHLNQVTGGALRRGGDRPLGVTYRALAQRGLAERPLLLVGTTLGFGRGLDQPVTSWASMGHPDYLRAEVTARLGVQPEAIYQRQAAPLPSTASAGHAYLAILALLLGLGVVLARWRRRLMRLSVAVPAVVLTLIAALLWLVAAVSAVRELWLNEALLVFWPADLLLLLLAGPRRQWYLRIRLGGLLVVGLLLLTGVFVQPLGAALLVPALPCLALVERPWWPRPPVRSSGAETPKTPGSRRKPSPSRS